MLGKSNESPAMKGPKFVIHGLCAAMLAGCGGSQPSVGAPGAMPQTSAIAIQPTLGKSWILPEAKSEDLIYAVGGCGGTCILSYPRGKLVGEIPGYFSNYFEALCSDGNGNVYLTDDTQVVEFAHGGTTPIATFSLPGTQALGCSVDPMTGDLAVVFNISSVAVFPSGSSNPTVFSVYLEASYCGYDNSGNLFVDGYFTETPGLAELPKGGNSFEKLSLDQNVGQPGQVQWDGEHLSYESIGQGQNTISQLSISGSSVTVVGQTVLHRARGELEQSWIYKGSVIAPYGRRSDSIGIWKYPKGSAVKLITAFRGYDHKTFFFTGATISVARSH
jgi:hypothetical protein